VGLIPHPLLVPKVQDKSIATPLLTLRTCVAYKKGENLPTYSVPSSLRVRKLYHLPLKLVSSFEVDGGICCT